MEKESVKSASWTNLIRTPQCFTETQTAAGFAAEEVLTKIKAQEMQLTILLKSFVFKLSVIHK